MFDVTFPQIVVAGTYVGGADDVIDCIENRELPSLLAAGSTITANNVNNTSSSERSNDDSTTIPWNPSLAEKAGKPDMLTVPHMREGGYPRWPWFTFQWCLYVQQRRRERRERRECCMHVWDNTGVKWSGLCVHM